MAVKRDVVILGGGFGGSLMAMVLHRLGQSVTLIERSRHPRFAIGESSTPTADFVLRDICRRYELPQVAPLCQFGTWRQTYRNIACGLKRGFSYFRHTPQQRFSSDALHANELFVAASDSDGSGDTHWYRADVDTFLVEVAQTLGVEYLDQTEVKLTLQGRSWLIECRGNSPVSISTPFVIDGTGAAELLANHLGLDRDSHLRTRSWSVFGHFTNVTPWHNLLPGDFQYPFDADHSAQHHVLDEGWMWQLGFHHGITSAGLALHGDPREEEADRLWNHILSKYPSVADQFAQSEVIEPLRVTKRLQRKRKHAAGENFALLPHSYGFIDPLHSTGIAHTICSIESLGQIFEQGTSKASLNDYSVHLDREFWLIDVLVSLCYRTRQRFPSFVAATMLYFAAATMFERKRRSGELVKFLCSNDDSFLALVKAADRQLVRGADDKSFVGWLRDAIQPFNHVGLMNPDCQNMYARTAK